MVRRLLPLAVASALLAACSVGPNYVRPDSPMPDHFVRAVANDAPAPSNAGDAREFWHRLNDPVLDRIVDDTLAANYDLQAAVARFDRANALLRGARLDLLPTVTAHGEASRDHLSHDQGGDGTDLRSYSAQAVASWEIDLSGRIRRGIEAQRADAWATAADLDALQVSLVGDAVRTYVELRGTQERLRVARENAANQQESLRLVKSRVDAGRDNDFDLVRSRALLETTQSRIPALEAEEGAAMHRLAVLTGRTPEALIATLSPVAPIPIVDATLDGETPASVVRRRPDVAAAEHRLHAATARIGVATGDLFPKLTLGGLFGTQAIDSGDLFGSGTRTRFVALGIDWSFLDIGHVRARIRAADADADAALADYQQAVLLALEDTETALLRHDRANAETEGLARAAADSTRAAELARLRYRAGASSLLEVLDADRVRLQAEDALADARARSAVSGVAVYRALASGWPNRQVHVADAVNASTAQR
ncbi:multidrug efflux system outer membrane protein [Lysobacter sp. HA35]